MGTQTLRVLLAAGSGTEARTLRIRLEHCVDPWIQVTEAATIAAALTAVSRSRPDVVVMSPELTSGIERFLDAFPELPLVALLSAESDSVADELIARGVQDCLSPEAFGHRSGCTALSRAVLRHRLRTKAQQHCNEEEEKNPEDCRALITASPDAMIVVGMDQRIRYLNPAAEKLLNRDATEAVGMPFGFPIVVDETAQVAIVQRPNRIVPVQMRAVACTWQARHGTMVVLRDMTSEEDSRRRIRELAQFAAENPNPMFRVSTDGRVLYANDPAGRLLHEWKRASGEPFPRELRRAANEAVATARPVYPEIRVRGRTFSFCVVSIPRGDHVNLYGTDVSERKSYEQRLKRSEERFRILYEYAPDAFYLNDLRGRFIDGNRAAEQLTGYGREELKGKSFFRAGLLSRDQAPRAVALLAANLTGKPSGPDEFRITCRDGSVVPVEIRTFPVKVDDRRMVLGIARDIRERIKTEEALRRSEARLRTVIENMPIMLAAVDEHGGLAAWNKECEKVTGYALEDLRKKPEAMAELVAGKGPALSLWGDRDYRDREVPLKARDGSVKTVLWSNISAQFPLTGWTSWAVGVDITDSREQRREKEKLREQLLHAQKMEAIGRLAGGIAHDFNNILGGMMGYADLVKLRLSEDSPLLPFVGKITEAGSHAASLTRQLLTFARRSPTTKTLTDMHEIIRTVVAMLRRTIDRKIEIITDLNASSSLIDGNRDQLENALLNLTINAVDAMPGGGTITLSTELVYLKRRWLREHSAEGAPGMYVKVSVKDTGTGMSGEVRERAFEPFFTTKESGKGTGLGLSGVFGSVKQHNGCITLDSAPDKGTTIELYLPQGAIGQPQEEARDEQSAAPGNGTVLVVDDEAVIRESAMEMLSELGYTVLGCSAGREAVELFTSERESIDAVLLDLIMPNMNGAECFRLLREIDPAVRVVVVTGYTDRDAEARIVEEGAAAVVRKPFRLSHLSRVLAGVMEDRRERSAAR